MAPSWGMSVIGCAVGPSAARVTRNARRCDWMNDGRSTTANDRVGHMTSGEGPLAGLEGTLVVDLSEDIAGAYCTKLLGDAGATVVRAEPADGHALRRWSRQSDGNGGALFEFLAAGQRSVVGDGRTDGADVVVVSSLEGGRA